MIRQLLIDCRSLVNLLVEKGVIPPHLPALDLRSRLDTALAEQCTAADEVPAAWMRTTDVHERCGGNLFTKTRVFPTDIPLYTHPPHPQVNEPPSFDLIGHLVRQREFSLRTFGPGTRTAGVCDHIRKELTEIEAGGGCERNPGGLVADGVDRRHGANRQALARSQG